MQNMQIKQIVWPDMLEFIYASLNGERRLRFTTVDSHRWKIETYRELDSLIFNITWYINSDIYYGCSGNIAIIDCPDSEENLSEIRAWYNKAQQEIQQLFERYIWQNYFEPKYE